MCCFTWWAGLCNFIVLVVAVIGAILFPLGIVPAGCPSPCYQSDTNCPAAQPFGPCWCSRTKECTDFSPLTTNSEGFAGICMLLIAGFILVCQCCRIVFWGVWIQRSDISQTADAPVNSPASAQSQSAAPITYLSSKLLGRNRFALASGFDPSCGVRWIVRQRPCKYCTMCQTLRVRAASDAIRCSTALGKTT